MKGQLLAIASNMKTMGDLQSNLTCFVYFMQNDAAEFQIVCNFAQKMVITRN